MSGTEAEFAACLLTIGGPPRLRHASSQPSLKDRDEWITTSEYMFAASDWYGKHVEKPPTTIGEHSYFPTWWLDYKRWLVENRNE